MGQAGSVQREHAPGSPGFSTWAPGSHTLTRCDWLIVSPSKDEVGIGVRFFLFVLFFKTGFFTAQPWLF